MGGGARALDWDGDASGDECQVEWGAGGAEWDCKVNLARSLPRLLFPRVSEEFCALSHPVCSVCYLLCILPGCVLR